MKKLLLISVLFFILNSANADEAKEKASRKPAGMDSNIQVYTFPEGVRAQKWVDCATGVVCYAGDLYGAGSGVSCLKVGEPWCNKK